MVAPIRGRRNRKYIQSMEEYHKSQTRTCNVCGTFYDTILVICENCGTELSERKRVSREIRGV